MDDSKVKLMKSMIRAVLQSSKEGVLWKHFSRDYRDMTGEDFPYVKLGYQSLDAYFRTIPDTVSCRINRDGEMMYHAVTDNSTAHLAAMISKQRTTKKKKGRGIKVRSTRRPSYMSQRRSVNTSFGPMASPRTSYMKLSSRPYRTGSVVHNARTMSSRSNDTRVRFGSSYTVPPRFQKLASPEETRTKRLIENYGWSYKKVPDVDPREALKKSGIPSYKSLLNLYSQWRFRGSSYPMYKSYENATSGWHTILTFAEQVFSINETVRSRKECEELAAQAAVTHFYNHILSYITNPKKYDDGVALTATESPSPDEQLQSPPPLNVKPRPATKAAKRDCDDEQLAQRIKQIIQQKPNGLWYTRLIPEYKNRYSEEAPSNILERLQDWTDIVTMEKFQGKYILYPAKEKPAQSFEKRSSSSDLTVTDISPSSDQPKRSVRGSCSTDLTVTTVTSPSSGEPRRSVRESCSSIDAVTDQPTKSTVKQKLALKPTKPPAIGSTHKIMVSHIESCTEFYVHHIDCDVNQVMDLVAKHYDLAEIKPAILTDYSLGDYCMAYYAEDKCWCRAIVLSYDKSFDEADIQFVDFGNKTTVAADEIRELIPECVAIETCAIRCELHGIRNTKLTTKSTDKNHSGEFYEKFDKFTEGILTIKVIEYTGNGCSVELRCADGENIITKLLSASGPSIKKSANGSNTVTPPVSPECIKPLVLQGSMRETPPDLVYPEGDYWDVFVSHVGNSANDVYIGLIGAEYSDSLDELESEMMTYFTDSPTTPTAATMSAVQVGQIYALFSDDAYYRVKIAEIEQNKVRVEYVDHGDSDVVDIFQLKLLPAIFRTLPFQAITVSLVGLNKFATNEKVVKKLTEMAVGKVFVAFVMERGEDIKVELIDTSTADDVSVNEVCLNLIADGELSARLPLLGGMVNGFVSHVTQDGSIFVQIEGPGLDRLNELMNDMRLHYTKRTGAEEFVSRPQVGKLYCAKYPMDGNWYRAIIKQLLPTKKVEVFYVDYGNREVISISQLREPTKANQHIVTLPYQAKHCLLSGIPVSSNKMDMIEWAKELLDIVPTSDVVSIKVVQEASTEHPPVIELYLESVDTSLNELLLQTHKQSQVEKLDGVDVPLPDDSESSSVTDDVTKSFSDIKISGGDNVTSNLKRSEKQTQNTVSLDTLKQQQTEMSISDSLKIANNSKQMSSQDQKGRRDIEECEIRKTDASGDGKYSKSVNRDSLQGTKERKVRCEIEEGEILSSDEELEEIQNYHSLSLPPPLSVVDVDEYMDVHVSLVTDPSTFMCQPWSNYDDLDDMVENMKLFYNTHVYQCPKIKVDGIYAALYDDDGYWYRVQVKDLLNEQMVAMYMLDLGHYDVVAIENIQPLVSEFRKLPFQAITASLAGVKPKKDSERFSDQVINRFFDLTYHKEFVAQIVDKSTSDKDIITETHIKVILCDTSDPNKDVYIDRVLIDEGLVSSDSEGSSQDR